MLLTLLTKTYAEKKEKQREKKKKNVEEGRQYKKIYITIGVKKTIIPSDDPTPFNEELC